MYLEHFGLEKSPFEGPADPRTFHPTRAHRAALDALVEALRDAKSPILLEGARGCGKTMLLRALAGSMSAAQTLVVIETEARRRGGPWPAIEHALGLPPARDERGSEEAVRRHLSERAAAGSRTAIAIDDTHNLPDYWIDQIDLLLTSGDVDVAMVLAAEIDFGAVSRSPAAERVRERFQVRVRIDAIAESECRGYLEALLMAAGCRQPRLFSKTAVHHLHQESAGLPGSIGALAQRALLVAYGRGADLVDDESMEEASRRLHGARPAKPPVAPAEPEVAPATMVGSDEPVVLTLEPRQRPRPVDSEKPVESVESVPSVESVEFVEPVAAQGGARLAVGGGTAYGGPYDLHQIRAEVPVQAPGPIGMVPAGPTAAAAGPGGGASPSSADPATVTPIIGTRVHPETANDVHRLQQEVLAGIQRPDRPRWDRAKHDPYRNPMVEDPPFGPEGLPVISDPHGDAAEWFRVLRLGLEEWMQSVAGHAHSVLVTSADAGAGKTFVAANLALLFANEPAIRVLLVDANMRRPRFEGLFGVPSRLGLADVLAGRAELEDSVNFVSEVGLSVLTAGRSGNPRDLASADRFEAVLQQMKRTADLVIVDAPALNTWVDARSMAAAADGVLLVTRSGKSRAPDVVRGVRSLDGGNLIGAVITGVDGQSSGRHAAHRRPRR